MTLKANKSEPCKLNPKWLVEQVDSIRLSVNGMIDPVRRVEYGQFMTPSSIGIFMASLFQTRRSKIHLIDPGAGVGSLSATFIASMLKRSKPPKKIHITAYEIDPILIARLRETMSVCKQVCKAVGVEFNSIVLEEDFIKSSVQKLRDDMSQEVKIYDCVIINPPYRKISSSSEIRRQLRLAGIETSNLYSAFMALAVRQLRNGGELVSISPRSFCNGPYFKHFRLRFLDIMSLKRIHVYESRKHAFKDDDVLQENVIIHAIKFSKKPDRIMISGSSEPNSKSKLRRVRYSQVVDFEDPDRIIHLILDDVGEKAISHISQLPAHLSDLGLSVSTGRVVDFRAKCYLRQVANSESVPLIYPLNFVKGVIKWPIPLAKKPNSIVSNEYTVELLVPPGTYVLVKRFSAKEERRRIVAAVYDSSIISKSSVGFENHLNYYHDNSGGIQKELATGLSLFLNSTIVDIYFRQFSGHTQVNASDLRHLRYPSKEQLLSLASEAPADTSDQSMVDSIIDKVLFPNIKFY